MRALTLMVCVLQAACTPPDSRFEISVITRDGDGSKIEGARLWLDGRDLGLSNVHGELRTVLHRHEGQDASLAIACPPGTRTDAPTRRVPLHSARTERGVEQNIEIHVRCEAAQMHTPIVVQLDGPGDLRFPLTLNGVRVGATDRSGTAHLLTEVQPRAVLHLGIDTSARPRLRPEAPAHTLHVGHAPRVLLVTQTFEASKMRVRGGKTTRRAPTRQATAPYRIH